MLNLLLSLLLHTLLLDDVIAVAVNAYIKFFVVADDIADDNLCWVKASSTMIMLNTELDLIRID